ncbi:ACP phosphodiesterase [Spirosoma spitsbergense]|uniref:acyl carrier protein phosphodiesterase n=1 Tax=Spirosoma spitsbergense TaxID=431554 RepID=UPI000360D721|nr:acyl carrier protein phosphodiesterase [Spirosoma spitsbergense]
MNILAHAYLSDRQPGLVIGNFIGDFIKGNPKNPRHNLTSGEVTGVRLHRAIDTFTDAHPDVAAVRDLLHPRCHKYAGAAVDIFFDHFLAVDFLPLTGETLSGFVPDFYHVLTVHAARLPPAAGRMAEYMIRQDWLTNYQFAEGIDRSLKGVSRRTAYPSGLDTAIIDFTAYYDQIARHFSLFWPALVEHCQQTRTLLLSE